MYKIYKVTVTQEGGDIFKKSMNKTVENKKELEALREEFRVQYGGGRVCLVYGEIEEEK